MPLAIRRTLIEGLLEFSIFFAGVSILEIV
jgi:hypothetical protein